MRKKLTSFLLAILLVVSMFTVTGCDLEQLLGGVLGSKDGDSTPPEEYAISTCYQVEQEDKDDKKYELTNFHDDEYYYNSYYIGQIKKVPIVEGSSQAPIYYDGGEITRTYTTSKSSEESVKTAITIGTEHSINFEVGGGVTIGNPILVSGNISIKVGGEYKYTQEESIENTVAYTEGESLTDSRTFKNEEHGYYRRTLFVNMYQFVIVQKDKITGDIDSFTYSTISGQYYAWEYSKTDNFKYKADNKFNLDGLDFKEFVEFEANNDNYIGKNSEVIFISTAEQFKDIKGTNHYVLKADIDLTAENWVPIQEFGGIIDGNGFSITFKSASHANGYGGLIASLNGGAIKNLTVKNSSVIYSTQNQDIYAGILAGEMKNEAEISNCSIKDSKIDVRANAAKKVADTPRYSMVGGFVGNIHNGKVYNSTIINSTIYGYGKRNDDGYQTSFEKEGLFVYVGGISGKALGANIDNCKLEKTRVEGKGEIIIYYCTNKWNPMRVLGRLYVGGIVGCAVKNNNIPTSTNKFTEGTDYVKCEKIGTNKGFWGIGGYCDTSFFFDKSSNFIGYNKETDE